MGTVLKRDLSKVHPFFRILTKITLLLMIIYNAYVLTVGRYDIYEHMFINLAFVIPISFILYSPTKKYLSRVSWYDLILILISYVVTIVFWRNYYNWVFNRMWLVSPLSTEQLLCGMVLLFLLVELVRRIFGYPLLILSLICLTYGFLCPYLPYPLGFRTQPIKILDLLLFTPYGILSTPLEVMVTYVVAFTLLGSALQLARADTFFIDLTKSLVGRSVGGIGKVSVLASALFGTISGSAVANVYATGTITIPTMINMRYPKELAAAIEAVASTGGQLTPPIMGAAAFVMAEILGVPYLTIVIAAIIPAILYYFSLYVQLHYTSLKLGLLGLSRNEIPKLSEVVRKQWYCVTPLVVFLYLLIIQNWGPISSAMVAFYLSLFIALFRKEVIRKPSVMVETLTKGMEEAISVILVACVAGIVVGILTYTGITLKFGSLVMRASFNVLEIALTYIALLTILVGMGVPTTAAYIMTSAVALPALNLFGVKGIVAHMFVFYYAILSAITPPVALAAFASANIARAQPMKVGVLAVRLGLVLFFLPFSMVSKPELLIVSGSYSLSDFIISLVTSLMSCFSISVGLAGYLKGEMGLIQRLAFILCGLVLLYSKQLYMLLIVVSLFFLFYFIRNLVKETGK
ncbi:MAG: TRAP transporter fused permease subunit [Sulfolobales archaeon]|nr:TRAP transporter fused permease subunit [Sulfolobales archaeon]